MVRFLIIFFVLIRFLSFAQTPDVSQDDKNLTLQQRYLNMKSKAETYQEYKVIKENLMDGVWKIMQDSIRKEKLLVEQERQKNLKLEVQYHSVKDTLTQERSAITQIMYNSSHISVLGIDFKKSVFLIFVTVVLSLLLLIGSVMIIKIKFVQTTAKEKIVIADAVTREFDEFKKKSMEKQTKLARELQTERNKITDLKHGKSH